MNTLSIRRLAALVCGNLFLLSALASQETDRKLVFRDLAQVQQLRVVCSQRHFGRIEDLVVDVPSGRVRAAVVTMQLEAKAVTVLVPFADLRYEPNANLLQLASCLEKDDKPEAFDPTTLRVTVVPPANGGAARAEGSVLASRLRASTVQLQGAGPGSVQGLTLELTGGHVAFLDLAGNRERAGDAQLHPVPWAALGFVSDGLASGQAASAPMLAMAKTAAELAAAPNLIDIIVSDPLYRAKVYAVWGGRPEYDRL